MQISLRGFSDFDGEVVNGPLVLLQRVQKLMHTLMRERCLTLKLLETLSSLLNLHQMESKPLIYYTERFKQE